MMRLPLVFRQAHLRFEPVFLGGRNRYVHTILVELHIQISADELPSPRFWTDQYRNCSDNIRSSRLWPGSNIMNRSMWLACLTSTRVTERVSAWSATALTGRLPGSSTSNTIMAAFGSSAPPQRRGRNGPMVLS